MSEDNTELFNWYETKEMKKMLPKDDNYDYSKTGIKPNSRILCCGTTGAGKTQALLHYIRLSPCLFSKVIVFYKESEYLYDLLKKGLDGAIEFFNDLGKLPKLKDLRKDMDDNERVLLVLDDWMLELKNYPNVNDYLIYGRKKNITLFCLSQDYYRIPKVLRNQMTYLLLFEMVQKKDVNLILSEFDNEQKQLAGIYKSIVSKPNNFMKIQTTTCPRNKKISRNFNGYIEDFN